MCVHTQIRIFGIIIYYGSKVPRMHACHYTIVHEAYCVQNCSVPFPQRRCVATRIGEVSILGGLDPMSYGTAVRNALETEAKTRDRGSATKHNIHAKLPARNLLTD